MTFEEIENKQNELRNLRNEYTDKSRECQKEIDMLELKKYESPKLLGKIIKIQYEDKVKYLFVNKIERLFKGPRCSGPSIKVYYKNEKSFSSLDFINVDRPKTTTYDYYALIDEDEYTTSWEESQKIVPLENTEEIKEIMKQISQDVNNIFY